jgi:hypothetical protein
MALAESLIFYESLVLLQGPAPLTEARFKLLPGDL